MSGNASGVEATGGIAAGEGIGERLAEGGRPAAVQRQQAADDRRWRVRIVGAAGVGYGEAGPVKPADAGDLTPGVFHQLGVDRLLCLENGVHAFGGDDRVALELKNEGRNTAGRKSRRRSGR